MSAFISLNHVAQSAGDVQDAVNVQVYSTDNGWIWRSIFGTIGNGATGDWVDLVGSGPVYDAVRLMQYSAPGDGGYEAVRMYFNATLPFTVNQQGNGTHKASNASFSDGTLTWRVCGTN
jgi:hypothetical protein